MNASGIAIYKIINVLEISIRGWKGEPAPTHFPCFVEEVSIVAGDVVGLRGGGALMLEIASEPVFAVSPLDEGVAGLGLVGVLVNLAPQLLDAMGKLAFVAVGAEAMFRVVLAERTLGLGVFVVGRFSAVRVERRGVEVVAVGRGL